MPVTLKTGVMKYRKSDGTYSVMDALMQEPTNDQISAIETAGQEQVDAVEQKGQDILDSLPEDYTELETDVSGLKSALTQPLNLIATDFESGGFNVYGLNSAASETYQEIRSMYIDVAFSKIEITLTFDSEQYIAIYGCAYDADKNPIPDTNQARKPIFGDGRLHTTATGSFEIPREATYFRIFFRTFGLEYSLNIVGINSIEKVVSKIDDEIEKTNETIALMTDSSVMFADFYSLPTYNATYYGGGIKEWGTTTARVINTKTIAFPTKTKVYADSGYQLYAYVSVDPRTITGNGALAIARSSNAFVQEFEYLPNENIFIVFTKRDGSAITPSEWNEHLKIETVPLDIATLQDRVEAITPIETTYKMGYGSINVERQGYNISKLSYNPQEATGKLTQGMAINNGVIFQGFGNGTIDLYDFETGTFINSYSADGGHCGSLSFSTEYYDPNDEFPLLYVASYNNLQTYVYRVTRTSCTKLKTYSIPTDTAGYLQETAVDKSDGTLWCVGHKINSYSDGGAWVVSHWNIVNAILSDGVYIPELISVTEMPWIPYLQYVQCFNGQLIVGTGSDATVTEEQNTKLFVIDPGDNAIKAVMNDFTAAIKNAENEGCDFVLDNNGKYFMILCVRHSLGYYKITF